MVRLSLVFPSPEVTFSSAIGPMGLCAVFAMLFKRMATFWSVSVGTICASGAKKNNMNPLTFSVIYGCCTAQHWAIGPYSLATIEGELRDGYAP